MSSKKVLILTSLLFLFIGTSLFSEVLFEDDFDGLNTEIWTVISGNWQADQGYLVAPGEVKDIILLNSEYSDFCVETAAKYIGLQETIYGHSCGIIFDYTGESNYGFFGWGPIYDGFLYINIGENHIPISSNWNLNVEKDQTVNLKLQKTGNNLRAYVNDKLVCDYSLTALIFPQGKIGLQSSGINCNFDYLKITDDFNTKPAVYVTSDRGDYLTDASEISVYISGINPGTETDVDLYFLIIDPDQNFFLFPNWNLEISPFSFTISENFYLPPTQVFKFKLPNDLPPISKPGDYLFATALTEHGTMNFTQEISIAEFKIIFKCPDGMVEIPPGIYTDRFGNESETDRYCIDVYEYPNVEGEIPIHGDSWYFANTECIKDGKHLCAEPQWTKACKGPNNYRFIYGNDFDQNKCRSQLEFPDGPAASGAYSECKNDYGVYDMSGNVWEWTSEVLATNKKVLRGGAWHTYGNVFCDHYYDGYNANNDDKSVGGSEGFRCCK